MNVKLELQQCPYRDTMERRDNEEIFKKTFFCGNHALFFSYYVLLFCGRRPTGGNGKAIYLVSAAGLAVLMPGFACGCLYYIRYLRKKLDEQGK